MKLDCVIESAEKIQEYMVEIRRYLHKHPELSKKEYNTQQYIISKLEEENIPCYKIADTGVVGIIKGRQEGRVIGIRADIDALPILEESSEAYCSENKGVMHACGHDAHTAILLGTAKLFNSVKDQLNGSVKLFFQPAEETVGGAKRMVEEGCMENPAVDYVIGLHVMPYIPYDAIEIKYGQSNAATNAVKITVKGKAAHGAYPEKGIDGILIASHMVCSLQSLVSRNVSPLNPCALTIGMINGGVKENVIAEEVVLKGTLRTLNPETRSFMKQRIKDLCAGIAASFGGECEVEVIDDYPALINDNGVIDVIRKSAEEVLGKDKIHIKEYPSLGSEDFQYFAENIPGAFYSVGCKLENKGEYALHTKDFDIDERCLKTGLLVHANTVLKLMEI
jgi:amidohydrolase